MREERGLTVAELAAKAKVTAQAIQRLENNPSAEPEFFNGVAIAEALGVTATELAGYPSAAQSLAVTQQDGPFATRADLLELAEGIALLQQSVLELVGASEVASSAKRSILAILETSKLDRRSG
jgi:transcriptional regulator with XRE-family HTH domain